MSLVLRVGGQSVALDGADDLRALIAQAQDALAALDVDERIGHRPDGVPARTTGWRWTAPTGDVVTFSPTWATVWQAGGVSTAAGMLGGPFRVGGAVRTEQDATEWYAGWQAAGRPS